VQAAHFIMQPFELLKFTRRNNCRECGYPACLAFTVAVTNGGEDPGRCPYVDMQALGNKFAKADYNKGGLSEISGRPAAKGMALIAHLKGKIRQMNFAAIASNLGCAWSGATDCLHFYYLGREVLLSRDAVLLAGQEIDDPRDQILLYNYIFYGGGAADTREWVGMESLPNSISKVRTLRVYCEERIAGRFSGQEALLRRCAVRMDGTPEETMETSCTAAFEIKVLPNLALVLLFWDQEPADGFPARVKVLYDRNVLSVLDIESLVFASERLAERLMELSDE